MQDTLRFYPVKNPPQCSFTLHSKRQDMTVNALNLQRKLSVTGFSLNCVRDLTKNVIQSSGT